MSLLRPAALVALLSVTSLSVRAQPVLSSPDKADPREQGRDLELMVGVGTALVLVPGTLVLGQWLGTLSNNLVLASVPALGVAGLIPPIAVAMAAWLVSPARGEEGGSLLLAIGATVGVHVVAMVVAGLLGLNAHEPIRVALFTAADAVLLPTAAMGTLQLTAEPQRQPFAARIVSFSF